MLLKISLGAMIHFLDCSLSRETTVVVVTFTQITDNVSLAFSAWAMNRYLPVREDESANRYF